MKYKLLRFSLLCILTMLCGGSVFGGTVTKWVLTNPTELATGDVVAIVDQASSTAMSNDNGTSSSPSATAVTLSEDKSEITGTVGTTLEWTVTVGKMADSDTITYQFGNGTNHLYCTNSNSGVRVGSNSNNIFVMRTSDNTGNSTEDFLFNKATNRYIGVYYDKGSPKDWRCYTSVNSNIKAVVTAFYKKVVTESATAPEAPTFAPAAGTYYTSQEVQISCATDGAEIYYSTNGEDYDKYTSSFPVTSTKTVYAYASKDGENSSTVSATYVIGNTYDAFKNMHSDVAADGFTNTAIRYRATGGMYVAFINGSNAYLIDGEGNGMLVYDNTSVSNLTVGQKMSYDDGYLTATLTKYQGNSELTNVTFPAMTGGTVTVTPAEKTLPLTSANQSTLVTLKGLTYTAEGTTLSDGTNTITYYDKFKTNATLEDGKKYDVTGIVVMFNDKIEICPRTATDVVEATSEEQTGFRDIKANLTGTDLLPNGTAPEQYTDVSTGVAVAADGSLSRVATDAAEAAAVFNGKWHGTKYGWNNFTASVPVEGYVKITLGASNYGSGAVIVTNSDGDQVAKIDNHTGAMWSTSNPDNVAVGYYRTNEPTTLTFSKCDYLPYFAVEAIAEEDLPAEVIAKPLITPSTGTYTEAQSVTITCETSGATIYYTTDGNDPTAESTAYTAAFDVTETTTVKAIAIKGDKSSEIAESVITIGSIAPGTSNLEWSYDAENPIPNSSPDNGLYYGSYVNDPAGTKNGMHGVKLNGSGYAFFAKNAVEGKLTLTFGPRDGSMDYAVDVYACTIDGATATKGDKIGSISVNDAPGTGSLEIPANVTGIYIQRQTSTEGVLQKIVFKEKIARTFTDFEMTNDELKGTYDTSKLPSGVTFSGTPHNDSHGYQNATITVPTDGGAVKFTIGGCQYDNPATFTVKNSDNETLATLNGQTPGCYHNGGIVTYIYSGDATTLTFGPIAYLPYFKAEAVEVTEATITYKDQNGTELGKKTVYEGDAIGEVPYTEADLTIADGYKFRGWTYTNGVKVKATDLVDGSKSVLASVTAIEADPTVGSIQNYDLTSAIFYPEDHENFDVTNAAYYNNHGWNFAAGGSFSVKVAGKAQVVLTLCEYGNGTTITVTDADNNVINDAVPAKAESGKDGATTTVKYTGEATTLTFTFAAQSYLHKVSVFNVNDFVEKDETSGYYIVPAGDAAGLVLAINSASSEANSKVFLPNGTYDLGTTALTTISGTNVSIIGESMEGVIIKNRPEIEGIGITATLLNTSTGLYMQDLTLDCVAPYGTGDDTSSAERGVTLHDKGTKTICKNVYLKGLQDTYYCNNNDGQYYFEDGKIEGTVDYICGNGDAYFNKVALFNAKRTHGNSGDVIAAPNTPLRYGYIFNECTIDGVDGQDGQYSLGRPWAANTQVIYLNTTMKIQPLAAGWTDWSPANAVKQFAEYGSVDAKGDPVDTSKRKTTFNGVTNAPTLNETQVAAFALETVFAGWDPAQYTKQVKTTSAKFDGNTKTLTWAAVDGATMYAIVKNGSIIDLTDQTSYTIADETQGAKGLGTATDDPTAAGDTYAVRAANGRGGFGEAVVANDATGIDNITTDATGINGTITEVYSMGGARLAAPQKGVNIVKVKANDGSVKTVKVVIK